MRYKICKKQAVLESKVRLTVCKDQYTKQIISVKSLV
jgi:hypothetical protein